MSRTEKPSPPPRERVADPKGRGVGGVPPSPAPAGSVVGSRRDRTKKTVRFIVDAGGEVQRVRARRSAAAERQLPQTVDGQRPSIGAAQRGDEDTLRRECIHPAVTEIADQHKAAG